MNTSQDRRIADFRKSQLLEDVAAFMPLVELLEEGILPRYPMIMKGWVAQFNSRIGYEIHRDSVILLAITK